MIKNLSRESSLKTFENDQTSVYGTNPTKNILNFLAISNKRNQKSSQKSFQFIYTAKGERSKDPENIFNRVNSSNNFQRNNSYIRKPLNQILKSNKQPSFHGLNKSSRDKIFNQTFKTQTKSKLEKNQTTSKLKIQENNVSIFNTFQDYQRAVEKNLSLIKLKQNFQVNKNNQSGMRDSLSQSKSSKRKGLQCTLYQKSIQKKINESEIKSNKKHFTVKKRLEKTQKQQGIDNQAPKKDIKKVLLKRKTKQSDVFNQVNSFQSIILDKTIQKRSDQSSKKINLNCQSLSKVKQNIKSVSKSKRTALNELNRSMSLIRQTCRNHNFELVKKEISQKKNRKSESRHRNTVSKSKNELLNQSIKGKKVAINSRVEQNLNKVHDKYKFISNYLSDFDIIGKLNGYEIGGKQECKWILLLIDEVYDMIKHSQETKLKGIDYTRNYQYSSLHTEQKISNGIS